MSKVSVSAQSEWLCSGDKGTCIFFFQCSGVLESAQFLVSDLFGDAAHGLQV